MPILSDLQGLLFWFAALKDRFLSEFQPSVYQCSGTVLGTPFGKDSSLLKTEQKIIVVSQLTNHKVSIFLFLGLERYFAEGFNTYTGPTAVSLHDSGHLWEGPVVFNWPFAYWYFILCLFISLLMFTSTFTNT